MKKIIAIIIAVIIFMLLSFSGGYYMGSKKEPKIKIVAETKTEYKTVRVPMTLSELEAAAKSPIEITGFTHQDWLDIKASDGYKQSEKSFKVGTSSDGRWNYALYAGAGALVGVGLYAIFK